MSQDMFDRLRRLGLTKGTRNLKPAQKLTSARAADRRRDHDLSGDTSLQKLFPAGRLEDSADGACFVVENVYPAGYLHGHSHLSALLSRDPAIVADYCGEARLSGLDFRDFVFLDTETTGLYGAGTVAFMVGIGFFEESAQGNVFIVRQYFLRDHGDEMAMLRALDDFLAQRNGLITFNGHSFDLTILENRYFINRMPGDIRRMPHIDLLPLARRLWRTRIGSVALGNLEKELLAVRRTGEDVPGWLIPTLYNDFLRSHDARELVRVFYHNEIDMLSMVTLADTLLGLVAGTGTDPHPIDLYSLGKWQADIGMYDQAELTLRHAVDSDLPLDIYHKALATLALLLKRQQRNEEALPLWQQWAVTSMDAVDAHVELAKFYEWHEKDIKTAESWTLQALSLIDTWSRTRAELVRPALVHRLARLQSKSAQAEAGNLTGSQDE